MKAVRVTKYGSSDVLSFVDLPIPEPHHLEVLIKIKATSVTSADWRLRSGIFPFGFGFLGKLALGLRKPRKDILGSEFSGVVERVGTGVTDFKTGDEVLAFSDMGLGAHAEYRVMKAHAAIVKKPLNLSFIEAACLPFGAITALTFLRLAQIKTGQRILINGASGGVGVAAVQLARFFGAHVTTLSSQKNFELLRRIGAQETLDYAIATNIPTQSFDIVMDCVGKLPLTKARSSLKRDGKLLLVAASLPDMLQIPWIRLSSEQNVVSAVALGNAADLKWIADLAERGVLKAVVDRCYKFEDILDAHEYVGLGHKKGSVVITMP